MKEPPRNCLPGLTMQLKITKLSVFFGRFLRKCRFTDDHDKATSDSSGASSGPWLRSLFGFHQCPQPRPDKSRVRRVRFRRVCCVRNHQINVKSRTLHLQKSHPDLRRCPRHQGSKPKSQFAKQCHLQACHCPLDRSEENPGCIPGSFREASRRLQTEALQWRLRSSSFEYVSSPT